MIWSVCKSICRYGLLSFVDAHHDDHTAFKRPFFASVLGLSSLEAVNWLSRIAPLSIPRSKSIQFPTVNESKQQPFQESKKMWINSTFSMILLLLIDGTINYIGLKKNCCSFNTMNSCYFKKHLEWFGGVLIYFSYWGLTILTTFFGTLLLVRSIWNLHHFFEFVPSLTKAFVW